MDSSWPVSCLFSSSRRQISRDKSVRSFCKNRKQHLVGLDLRLTCKFTIFQSCWSTTYGTCCTESLYASSSAAAQSFRSQRAGMYPKTVYLSACHKSCRYGVTNVAIFYLVIYLFHIKNIYSILRVCIYNK